MAVDSGLDGLGAAAGGFQGVSGPLMGTRFTSLIRTRRRACMAEKTKDPARLPAAVKVPYLTSCGPSGRTGWRTNGTFAPA
jgi:hypothetical protein